MDWNEQIKLDTLPPDEIIKANGQAEALELSKTRECLKESMDIMQEIRDINLKTIEIQERVSNQISSLESPDLDKFRENIRGDLKEDIKKELSCLSCEDFREDIKKELSQLNYEGLKEDLKIEISELVSEGVKRETPDFDSEKLKEEIKELVSEGVKRETPEFDSEGLKKEISELVRQEISKAIGEDVAGIIATELTSALKEENKTMVSKLEEIIHREDVRVYKNVQASVDKSLEDKNAILLRDITSNMRTGLGGNKTLMILMAVTLLTSAANLILWILDYLGFIAY